MFESIVENATDWRSIEMKMLRNRVANLYELTGIDRETSETMAFLLDLDGLNEAVKHLSNKRMSIIGVQDGKPLWTEEIV